MFIINKNNVIFFPKFPLFLQALLSTISNLLDVAIPLSTIINLAFFSLTQLLTNNWKTKTSTCEMWYAGKVGYVIGAQPLKYFRNKYV